MWQSLGVFALLTIVYGRNAGELLSVLMNWWERRARALASWDASCVMFSVLRVWMGCRSVYSLKCV